MPTKNRKLKNEELGRLNIRDYDKAEKTNITVVLDNVRSLNNIGSVFRTADGFRIERIVLCGITAKPPHRDIRKTALGATETVPWTYVGSTLEAVKSLKSENYTVASIEQTENSIWLNEYSPEKNSQNCGCIGA